MRILLVNKFFYPRGGAEISFFETAKLLEEKGHRVSFFSMRHPLNVPSVFDRYFISRVEFDERNNPWQQMRAAGRVLYSFEARRNLRRLIEKENPEIAHLNNIHHHISPSIIHELRNHGIPMVMTLRDYKLVCPTYSLWLKGQPCERCAGGRYHQAFVNRCMKRSYLKSVLNVAEMYLHHNRLRVYEKVDLFISPSKFLLTKVHQMGFQRQILHLPNFVDLENYPVSASQWEEKNIIYFGRLSAEKGLRTLCAAVKGLDLTLHLVGDGPEKAPLEEKAGTEGIANIRFWGHQKSTALRELINRSMFVVLPSEWYENNPRTVIEAFALGKPVIGANIGGIPELVKHQVTGLLFAPARVDDLREKIQWFVSNPQAVATMGKKARALVEKELNPEAHYKTLMQIYHQAVSKNASF